MPRVPRMAIFIALLTYSTHSADQPATRGTLPANVNLPFTVHGKQVQTEFWLRTSVAHNPRGRDQLRVNDPRHVGELRVLQRHGVRNRLRLEQPVAGTFSSFHFSRPTQASYSHFL